MKSLFSPAVALMNRLGYSKKFLSLALISILAVGVMASGFFVNISRDIRTLQRELEGLTLSAPVFRVIQMVQRHRALDTGIIKGVESMRGEHDAVEKGADDAINALEAKLPPGLKEAPDWQKIRKEWVLLRSDGLNWTADANFAIQSGLIEQVLSLQAAVADEYELTLDTEASSHYLIDIIVNELPHVLEHLGQLRAQGVANLIDRRVTEQQRVRTGAVINELGDALRDLDTNLKKAARYNPALHDSLQTAFRDISSSVEQVSGLVESDILTGRFGMTPEKYYATASAAIDDSYQHLHESLLSATGKLLRERIARANNILYATISIACLLLLVVTYFAIGIYYSIIGNVQSLARSARIFASGGFHERIRLDTRDEIGQIGDSFNEMADGFNAMLAARKQAEERSLLLLESVNSGIVGLDTAGNTTFVNPAATRMLGYATEELIGEPFHAMAHHSHPDGSHYPGENCPMHQTLVDGRSRNVTDEVLWRKGGVGFPVEYGVHPVYTDGELAGAVVAFQDITEKKEKDEFILKQANYDALTGLPNRILFQDRLAQEIKKSNRTGMPFALLFIDLDRFKEINDTLGHDKGDRLLVEAARRINECVRETDTVARLGGDEFTVILPQFGERLHLERITQDINKALIRAFDLGGGDTGYISASIGIAIYPDDAKDTAGLLKHADQAMYMAKADGRNGFAYFTQSMQQEAQEELLLSNDLRNALAHGELQVYYQPIVESAGGRIAKAEALLRWNHPKRGMVSPAAFIPLAEESGVILEIGKWVLQDVTANIERWHRQLGLDIQVSVNISPVQFNDDTLLREWLNSLAGLGLPERSLAIEITEGLLIRNSCKVSEWLMEFHDNGIEVSIDDFGTGFSSLSYLKQFDIDYLKIDRCFVSNLMEDKNDRTLTEAIIVMAHKLGLKTIAEGVETGGQRDILLGFGCDYVQGYLYSRPVPVNEFEALLRMTPPGELRA